MDDANLPSLLSSPLTGYVSPRDEVYLNTRMFALSEANPYWAFGKVFNAIGGPHLGPTKGWPLASMVRVMTSDDRSGEEIRQEVQALLGSTDGLGMFHAPRSLALKHAGLIFWPHKGQAETNKPVH